MKRIDTFLELVVHQKGSDLHLTAGQPPRIRLYGDLIPIKYRELSPEETTALIYETMTDAIRQSFENRFSLDFAYEAPGLARFRVNALRHLHGLGAVLRVIPSAIRTLETLAGPPVLPSLCHEKNGLILVTGPTGSGKSTTLAAMIDYINRTRRGHIITIEDPVEFVHQRQGCLISHREVGMHTRSFAAALHSALREDPDVILVGELRDLETMSLAVTAAETGLLVFATLHTNGAAATIDRVINVFPASEQPRIRAMLSTSLRSVISQQLVRRADGRGQVVACEVLMNNPAIANLIREGKTHQIAGVLERSALVGMQSLDSALRSLVDAQLVTSQEAYHRAVHKQAFATGQEHAVSA
ncbi:MAG: type IV pilus twitching motility protein PilT [Candidatus Tectomicrobia bacterium]|uniref:Type IV pilus twitching motility protein PilT n=1 Tax=Tectimicrobiota bacterium TaxID=2528274 RepID=A0A937W3F4_UNCTE|nr:type IV pilus twitching motility protein PilT [Candidatus Tectomicrobia bacterium]